MINGGINGLAYGKNPASEKVCTIGGLKYKFTSVHNEYGSFYGYHPKRKKWALLNDQFIQFEGENFMKVDRWESDFRI